MLILTLIFILILVTSLGEDALVCAFVLAHLRATDFLAIMTLIQFRGIMYNVLQYSMYHTLYSYWC